MGARHIWVGPQPSLQMILTDFTKNGVLSVRGHTALGPLQLGWEVDNGNGRFVTGAQEEGNRETFRASRRCDDTMDISSNEAVGRQFEEFARVHDKRARHRRRINPSSILGLNAQSRN